MLTQTLGFPRIGANRELKKACELYWKGKISQDELELAGKNERIKNWTIQKDAGIDLIPSNDFSYYDQVADMMFMLGVVPERFRKFENRLSKIDLYFAMCRGYQHENIDVTPLEMTKWFNTNYHYLVPEFEKKQSFSLSPEKVVGEFREALQSGIKTKPVLLGPLSFLKLGKEKTENFNRLELIHILLPVYIELIGKLENAGATWIQIDEPCLTTCTNDYERQLYRSTLTELFGSFPGIRFVLATYFESVSKVADLISLLPLEVIHLDLVSAPEQLDVFLDMVPDNMSVSLGIVDGRNVWKNNLEDSLGVIKKAVSRLGRDRVILSPSCSLLHVPYDLKNEDGREGLPIKVKERMAFAFQKIEELAILKDLSGISPTTGAVSKLEREKRERENWEKLPFVADEQVRKRLDEINHLKHNVSRGLPFEQRRAIQQEKLQLPLFPTTMIGSLPQTAEVRKTRCSFFNNKTSWEEYDNFIKECIRKAIRWQEELGIDVLVHGEFERNDMVEFFGEQLNGFAFTQNGWVQSYGSRAVKPPVIYGDVSRKGPVTVDIARYAQSLTDKPVKGMLTGPVTILQWSFVRTDQPRKETAGQIALAIHDEVLDLEKAGISIIQIDEPAFREGLPLKQEKWDEYLTWAVFCFMISSYGVKNETQIHTHMCYAEFNDIIPAIIAMDADVISIETSRSQMELLNAFTRVRYPNQIGPGVYDIHSPRVPGTGEMCDLLFAASRYIPVKNLWVNPDCGLKTRGWDETRSAIKNMTESAKRMRDVILHAEN